MVEEHVTMEISNLSPKVVSRKVSVGPFMQTAFSAKIDLNQRNGK